MKPNKAVAVIVAVSIAAAGTSALAFGKMRGEGERGSRGEMRFEQLDTDKDGKITADEVTADGQKRAEKRFGKMLERLDADKDGALSLEELKGGERHAQMLDTLDADKDGFLSKDEMRKMRKMGKRHDHGKKSY